MVAPLAECACGHFDRRCLDQASPAEADAVRFFFACNLARARDPLSLPAHSETVDVHVAAVSDWRIAVFSASYELGRESELELGAPANRLMLANGLAALRHSLRCHNAQQPSGHRTL